jgi:AraC-like DNA-binding protein
MSILDLTTAERMLPTFISRQVRHGTYWFHDLSPRASRQTLAVCGGYERVAEEYEVSRAGFPFLAVEFVEEGRGTVELNGRSFPLYPGVAFAYGPGVAHRMRSEAAAPLRKHFVDFLGDRAEAILRSGPLGDGRPSAMEDPAEISELFGLLLRNGEAGTPRSPSICAGLVEVLLHKVSEKAASRSAHDGRALATFRRAKRLMQEAHLEIRSVEEAADRLDLSAAYLTRLFRRFDRVTPYRYLVTLRMSHAAGLLLRSDATVKDVAGHLGFSDAFHFSRMFKSVYGVSPRRFIERSGT